ncbi:uncharacterized protein BDZ83DRAFT_672500, partial [Colletotrichum acutatum]
LPARQKNKPHCCESKPRGTDLTPRPSSRSLQLFCHSSQVPTLLISSSQVFVRLS